MPAGGYCCYAQSSLGMRTFSLRGAPEEGAHVPISFLHLDAMGCRLYGASARLEWEPMSETVQSLLCDMLTWLAREPRPYSEVMDAWRTSCPRLPVWEDANERGFVEQMRMDGCAMVR